MDMGAEKRLFLDVVGRGWSVLLNAPFTSETAL
jgi:hypothetical protein